MGMGAECSLCETLAYEYATTYLAYFTMGILYP